MSESEPVNPALRAGRYIKYAIGEIVLVVIGILIALQINNWNEDQKFKKEEVTILNNLHENLIQTQGQSEAFIKKEEELRDLLIVALGIDGEKKEELDYSNTQFKDLVWDFETGVPVINSYSDIKSTGKLSIISNRDIRESFNGLELAINELNDLVSDRLTVQQMRIDEIVVNELNFIPLLENRQEGIELKNETPNDYESILSDPKTRNLLGIKLELTLDVLQNRKDLAEAIDNLIVLIESELDE